MYEIYNRISKHRELAERIETDFGTFESWKSKKHGDHSPRIVFLDKEVLRGWNGRLMDLVKEYEDA